MKPGNTLFGAALAVTMFCSLPASSAVVAQDVVTVGTVNSVGGTANRSFPTCRPTPQLLVAAAGAAWPHTRCPGMSPPPPGTST